MTRNTTAPLLSSACLLFVGGCLLFDAEFDESLVGGSDSGGAELTEVADHCAVDVPKWESNLAPRTISLHGMGDTLSDLNSCGVSEPQTGPEGFFSFDALAGERWHIMVRPTDPLNDLAVQVLSTCDERACVRAEAGCAHGHAEHLNFVPDVGGTYIVGVQALMHDQITVLAVNPPCGDGMVQHGESCDDGNVEFFDGCTPLCQFELLQAVSTEHEPNNERFEANVVRMPAAQSMSVSGQLGGSCDVDRFAVDVPEGASLRVTLLDAAGQPCPGHLPDIEMSLVDTRDFSVRGSLLGEGECPAIVEGAVFAESLSAGVYHITLEALHEDDGHTPTEPPAGDGGETGDGGHEGGHGGGGPIVGDPDLFQYVLELEVVAGV